MWFIWLHLASHDPELPEKLWNKVGSFKNTKQLFLIRFLCGGLSRPRLISAERTELLINYNGDCAKVGLMAQESTKLWLTWQDFWNLQKNASSRMRMCAVARSVIHPCGRYLESVPNQKMRIQDWVKLRAVTRGRLSKLRAWVCWILSASHDAELIKKSKYLFIDHDTNFPYLHVAFRSGLIFH